MFHHCHTDTAFVHHPEARHVAHDVQGSQQQAATLRHKFDDVRPTLLLFLQRLQCIVVNDATAGETSIMVR